MQYKDPNEALKTREENGFRVNLNDETQRFPTDETLKKAIVRVNGMARNHLMKPCPAGQECEICFRVKASAESDLLVKLMEEMMEGVLRPLAVALLDFNAFFSVGFFLLELGREVAALDKSDTTEAEIAALNKMLGLENNSSSESQKVPDPNTNM